MLTVHMEDVNKRKNMVLGCFLLKKPDPYEMTSLTFPVQI